jgi:hypothetical protein
MIIIYLDSYYFSCYYLFNDFIVDTRARFRIAKFLELWLVKRRKIEAPSLVFKAMHLLIIFLYLGVPGVPGKWAAW